jgi:hypothetical protein
LRCLPQIRQTPYSAAITGRKGCAPRNGSMPHPKAVDTTKTIPGEQEQGTSALPSKLAPSRSIPHTRSPRKRSNDVDGRASFFTLIRNSFRATRRRTHTRVSPSVCESRASGAQLKSCSESCITAISSCLYVLTLSVRRYARRRSVCVFAHCAQ